jgi:hypothetical protein
MGHEEVSQDTLTDAMPVALGQGPILDREAEHPFNKASEPFGETYGGG